MRPSAGDHNGDPALNRAFRDLRRNKLRVGTIPMTGSDRVHLQDWPLLDLIAAAYSVRAAQVSGPVWLSDQGFDIEARVPIGTQKTDINLMLQSLLEERFGLRVHRTMQTKQGYAITIGKGGPRLTPAESPHDSSPQLSKEEMQAQILQRMAAMEKQTKSASDDNNIRAGFSMQTWPSITLEELAHQLDRFTQAPVIDGTGLAGRCAVTIRVSNNPDVAGDSIFNAVEKLGLKLEPRKVSVETLIVDQISKTAAPN